MTLTSTHSIDDHTRLVGLFGRSRGGWPSPTVYNVAFDALALNWRCVPLTIPKRRLREALLGLRALGFVGGAVREPYHRAALNHLDALSPAAETIGFVNLIQVDERGLLIGDNTQWRGFLGALRTVTPSLNGLRPLVIGAGEAAQSAVYALIRQGLPVTIVHRDLKQVIDLVHRLRHASDEHSFSVYRWPDNLDRAAGDANLIINTVSAEAWSNGDPAWPNHALFPPDTLVLDLTRSSETPLVDHTQVDDATTTGGMVLRAYEVALAFESWTGHLPPLEVIFEAVREMQGKDGHRAQGWPIDTRGDRVLEQVARPGKISRRVI